MAAQGLVGSPAGSQTPKQTAGQMTAGLSEHALQSPRSVEHRWPRPHCWLEVQRSGRGAGQPGLMSWCWKSTEWVCCAGNFTRTYCPRDGAGTGSAVIGGAGATMVGAATPEPLPEDPPAVGPPLSRVPAVEHGGMGEVRVVTT